MFLNFFLALPVFRAKPKKGMHRKKEDEKRFKFNLDICMDFQTLHKSGGIFRRTQFFPEL